MAAENSCADCTCNLDSNHHTIMGRFMLSIKPRDLFEACEKLGIHDKPMLTFLPPSDIGSIRSIEAAVIVSLLRLLNPSLLLEIGTFKGFTTSLLAMNSNSSAQVYSIDLPKDAQSKVSIDLNEVLADGKMNDLYLIEQQFRDEASYIKLLDSTWSDKVRLIKADSTKIDFCEHLGVGKKFDFVFVDGGHDFHTAYSDSIQALSSIGENSIVLWHDFESSLHSEVSKAIAKIATKHRIHAITGTSFAIYLSNKFLDVILGQNRIGNIQDD